MVASTTSPVVDDPIAEKLRVALGATLEDGTTVATTGKRYGMVTHVTSENVVTMKATTEMLPTHTVKRGYAVASSTSPCKDPHWEAFRVIARSVDALCFPEPTETAASTSTQATREPTPSRASTPHARPETTRLPRQRATALFSETRPSVAARVSRTVVLTVSRVGGALKTSEPDSTPGAGFVAIPPLLVVTLREDTAGRPIRIADQRPAFGEEHAHVKASQPSERLDGVSDGIG